MPIKAFIGRPRQGKSYSVVKNVILPALKNGRQIVTDIPLKQKAYDEFPDQIIFQEDIQFGEIVKGAVYIIDEFWKNCEMGVSPKNVPEVLRHFIAMHGHSANEKGITTEIVIITQNLDQVCTYVTGLIETTYYVEKVKISDKISKCRTEEFNGSVKGNPPRAKPVGSRLDKYESEVFEYYKSHTGVDGENKEIIEMDSIKAKTLMDFKFVKYFPIALIVFLVFVVPKGISSFKSLTAPKEDTNVKPENIAPEPAKLPTTSANPKNVSSANTAPPEQSKPPKTDHSEKAQKLYEQYDFFDELNVFPMSQDKRITGVYKFHFGDYLKHGVHVTIKNQRTINVPMQNVQIDDFGEYFIVYRNEIITMNTGKPDQLDFSMLPDGSYVKVERSQTDANIVRGLQGQE